jgi:hypothetical protein
MTLMLAVFHLEMSALKPVTPWNMLATLFTDATFHLLMSLLKADAPENMKLVPAHTQTHKHTRARKHARTHANTRMHARTHARTHARARAHALAHTRRLMQCWMSLYCERLHGTARRGSY